MRRRLFALLLPLLALRATAADTFDESLKRAAGSYQAQIQQATQDLNRTRERLTAEKAPLLRARQAAEDKLLALERDVMRLEAQEQNATERRRKMAKEQDALRKTVNYLNSSARDALKAFEDGLAPGENQAQDAALQALQQALNEAAGGTTAQPAGDALDFLTRWTERATGGYAVAGRAVISGDNRVRTGTLVFLGPESFFLPDQDGPPTTLRQQSGATYPTGYPIPTWNRGPAEALFRGQPGAVQADASHGKALHLQETRGSVLSHIRSGGVVAYIILATGALALLLIIQKLRDLAAMRLGAPARAQAVLDAVAAGELADAEKKTAGLRPVVREIFATGLRHANRSKTLLEEQLQSLLHRQQMHFERRLSLLAVIATAAPLMGLLGTVSGMVKTFALMTVFGSGNAMKLSAGISEVLVATELGLMVAIPALVIHGFLSHRIRKNLSVLEHYAMEFVIALDVGRPDARRTRPAMKPLVDFVSQGGPVMAAILLLSVVLYARVCKLLLSLRAARRHAREQRAELVAHPALLRRVRDGLQESFRQQRFALGSMVAAAPLLGLLGTVGGMSRTFDTLAQRTAADPTGLAKGISEVLVATESGLAVAIPALLLIAVAQRQMQKQVQRLDLLEQAGLEGTAS